jgi:hypothetical protein
MLLIYADSSSLNLITLSRLSPSRLVCSNESNPSTRYWIFDNVRRLSACPSFSWPSSFRLLSITHITATLMLSLMVYIFLVDKTAMLLLYFSLTTKNLILLGFILTLLSPIIYGSKLFFILDR